MEAYRYAENTKPVFESRPFDSCLGPRGCLEMDSLVAGKRLCVDGKCGVATFVRRSLKKYDLDGRIRCGEESLRPAVSEKRLLDGASVNCVNRFQTEIMCTIGRIGGGVCLVAGGASRSWVNSYRRFWRPG